MILIVGLGNPGKKFERTRHNLGFQVLEAIKRKNHFPDFKLNKKLLAEVTQGKIGKKKIILAKPQTFMNLSGRAVKKLTDNFPLTTDNLWVVHDDIDLPLGKIKISFGRGSAGHKGVESIMKELGTKNFSRFRIGICPKQSAGPTQRTIKEGFVLQKFSKEEEKILKGVIKKTIEAIELSLKGGLEKAMTEFNQ